MEAQTFADAIGRIAIIDGIVRLDLVAHSATETGPDGKARLVLTNRVVMGVEQFLRAADKITQTKRLILEAAAKQAQPAPTPPAPQTPPAQTNRPQAVPPQYRREAIGPAQTAQPAPRQPFP